MAKRKKRVKTISKRRLDAIITSASKGMRKAISNALRADERALKKALHK